MPIANDGVCVLSGLFRLLDGNVRRLIAGVCFASRNIRLSPIKAAQADITVGAFGFGGYRLTICAITKLGKLGKLRRRPYGSDRGTSW